MSYIVAHCRKVQTTVGLAAVGRHNCREAVYDDQGRALGKLPEYITHPERAYLNEGDRCGASNILKNRSKRIQEADLTRKPQKNAASAIEVNISASADWFAAHKPDEWQKYFKDARKFLAEKYGKENILHWAVHCDETSPHMHVLMTPIIETKKGARYSSSTFLGGRKGLRDLQTEIAEDLGAKYGMERGQEGSNARHTDQYEWIEDTARMRKELERKEKELAEREARIARTEKVAKIELKPFVPKLQKKPAVTALFVFTLSNGKEIKGWGDYVAEETKLQANEYASKVKEIASAAQAQAAWKEEGARALQERARELEVSYQRYKNMSPKQLRDLADKREAETRAIEQRRNRDNDRGLGR